MGLKISEDGVLTKYTREKGVKEVVVPDGVTAIGEKAFYNCTYLTSIVIPDSVKEIHKSAFYNCTHLKSIVIPDSVKEIHECAFYHCSNLTSIHIPEGVKEIHDCTFFQCGSITEFKLPDTLEEIGQYAFSHCGGLKEIVIPKNVKKIGGFAFFFSLGLKSVILPEGLEEIGPLAFSRTWIEEIEIPGTVTRIGYGLFDNCIFIKDIKLSGECKSIYDGAFNGYLGKHTLMLPRREQPVPLLRETWDPSWGILPDYRPPSDIWFWLRHMEKVKHLIIPEFVTELPSYCIHGETLSSVTILGKIEKTGRNVFRNCSHIKYVIAPNTPITKFDRECRNIVFWGYIQAQKKKNIHYPEKIEKTYLKHFENNKERLLADGKNNLAFQEFLSKHEEM